MFKGKTFAKLDRKAIRREKKELFAGVNYTFEMSIKEFADYVKAGSKIDMVIHPATGNEKATSARFEESKEQVFTL